MYLAQALLKKQFPLLDGLQSSLLCQNDMALFPSRVKVCTSTVLCDKTKYCFVLLGIQIYHIGGDHWVTSTSIGREVTVYDSKFGGGDLDSSLTHQLALVYRALITVEEDGE